MTGWKMEILPHIQSWPLNKYWSTTIKQLLSKFMFCNLICSTQSPEYPYGSPKRNIQYTTWQFHCHSLLSSIHFTMYIYFQLEEPVRFLYQLLANEHSICCSRRLHENTWWPSEQVNRLRETTGKLQNVCVRGEDKTQAQKKSGKIFCNIEKKDNKIQKTWNWGCIASEERHHRDFLCLTVTFQSSVLPNWVFLEWSWAPFSHRAIRTWL